LATLLIGGPLEQSYNLILMNNLSDAERRQSENKSSGL